METGGKGLGLGGTLIFAWAVGGVCLVLLRAVVALTPLAVEGMRMHLDTIQWVALVAWVLFSIYAEGYRGFHTQFSPRVVRRALHLARNPRPLYVVLAAPYAMGLLYATPRRRAIAWGVVFGIVTLVIMVRMLPQPWRGIVDVGVVLGLALGLLSIAWFLGRALLGHEPPIPADVPEAA